MFILYIWVGIIWCTHLLLLNSFVFGFFLFFYASQLPPQLWSRVSNSSAASPHLSCLIPTLSRYPVPHQQLVTPTPGEARHSPRHTPSLRGNWCSGGQRRRVSQKRGCGDSEAASLPFLIQVSAGATLAVLLQVSAGDTLAVLIQASAWATRAVLLQVSAWATLAVHLKVSAGATLAVLFQVSGGACSRRPPSECRGYTCRPPPSECRGYTCRPPGDYSGGWSLFHLFFNY